MDELGSWILIALGVALVVLAAVLASEPAVAPVFAFTGVASIIVGVVLTRIEGTFELSATGLKAKLREVATREDLTLAQKGEWLAELGWNAGWSGGSDWSGGSGWGIIDAEQARRFKGAVQAELEDQGWKTIEASPWGSSFDLVGRRDHETVKVKVKASRHLSAADVEWDLTSFRHDSERDDPSVSYALAAPPGALSPSARGLVEREPRVNIMEVEAGHPSQPMA
jgi:hypothetical protein